MDVTEAAAICCASLCRFNKRRHERSRKLKIVSEFGEWSPRLMSWKRALAYAGTRTAKATVLEVDEWCIPCWRCWASRMMAKLAQGKHLAMRDEWMKYVTTLYCANFGRASRIAKKHRNAEMAVRETEVAGL